MVLAVPDVVTTVELVNVAFDAVAQIEVKVTVEMLVMRALLLSTRLTETLVLPPVLTEAAPRVMALSEKPTPVPVPIFVIVVRVSVLVAERVTIVPEPSVKVAVAVI